jgi:murein DD-endopeptidase MepM/ murein hydrolase activator NlpD
MVRSPGINGLAVGAMAAGGLLILSGIKDAPILDALRDLMRGVTPEGRAPNVTPIVTGAVAGADTGMVKKGDRLARPIEGPIGSPFGMRDGKMHRGVDIPAAMGTPIHAAASGTVSNTGYEPLGAGNFVQVSHPGGLVTKYFHMSKIIAYRGQKVATGDVLGLVGSTGHSSGPHLHFEVWDNGIVQNPINYL